MDLGGAVLGRFRVVPGFSKRGLKAVLRGRELRIQAQGSAVRGDGLSTSPLAWSASPRLVARRTNEIGIRMALGANRGSILGFVLRSAFTQVVLGLAIGIPVALAGGRLLSAELYGVKSHDPLILGLAVITLAACAFVAGLVPASRATNVDPITTLRFE